FQKAGKLDDIAAGREGAAAIEVSVDAGDVMASLQEQGRHECADIAQVPAQQNLHSLGPSHIGACARFCGAAPSIPCNSSNRPVRQAMVNLWAPAQLVPSSRRL